MRYPIIHTLTRRQGTIFILDDHIVKIQMRRKFVVSCTDEQLPRGLFSRPMFGNDFVRGSMGKQLNPFGKKFTFSAIVSFYCHGWLLWRTACHRVLSLTLRHCRLIGAIATDRVRGVSNDTFDSHIITSSSRGTFGATLLSTNVAINGFCACRLANKHVFLFAPCCTRRNARGTRISTSSGPFPANHPTSHSVSGMEAFFVRRESDEAGVYSHLAR